MEEKSNISEKLLRTNLMELLGGKGIESTSELLKQATIIPPEPPLNNNKNGWNDGNNDRIPELRSFEVNEILSKPPAWLIRWGITIFFFVLILMLAVTWFVRYPDLVRGNLKIVSQNLPKSVIAKTDGKLVKLLVNDGQTVQEGQKIAFFESTANHKEVLILSDLTDSLVNLTTKDNLSAVYTVEIPSFFKLGELQKSYQVFQEIFTRVKSFVGTGTYLQKRKMIENDYTQLNSLQINLKNQIKNNQKDLALAEDELESQKRLQEKGYVSKNDYRQAMSKVLSKQQSNEQMLSSMKNNIMSQNQKQQEILELDKTITEQKNALIQAMHTLKSDIESWKQRYIAIAPTAGKVIFLTSLQENQSVKTGQELLYVLPKGEGFHGEMNIGQFNFGKVKRGQEIIIKLQSYSYEEYGTLRGQIKSISEIPIDSVYFVKVSFPKGLTTSANKTIPFRNGMTATGEIITEDKRLIERFLKEFMSVFER
ncbi:HlyD family secretion protein [Emticicia sp. SJ17W-69]|uniref:HlyD family secretion protein n=1 Tax=Emticicia sp. SJ17W-69 TaxID=3421657 RepID=UPI003EBF7DE2